MITLGRKLVLALIPVFAVAGAYPVAASDQVFVPMGSENKVLVVDVASTEVVGEYTDFPDAHGLAITADFLVAGEYADRGASKPEKPEGMTEDEHAAHHGKSAESNVNTELSLSFITLARPDDGAVVRRIEVPGPVHHVAVAPDGQFAVATHPEGGAASIIDLRRFEQIALVLTGEFPNYAVVSSTGDRVYISNAGDDTVSEILADGWMVNRQIRVGSSPEHMVISPDGQHLFVNNVDDGSVSVVSIASGEAIRTIPIGGSLHGIDLSSDGETLFVSATEQDAVLAIDVTSGRTIARHPMPAPYHLTAINDAHEVYVTSVDEPAIFVLDQAALKFRKKIAIGGKGHQMVVSRH